MFVEDGYIYPPPSRGGGGVGTRVRQPRGQGKLSHWRSGGGRGAYGERMGIGTGSVSMPEMIYL